ncbi:MAG: bacteriohemerythrin [Proteobacteria bacterium]|nr:bacteriohemerythrin [Pseudomonadota bacterium]
MNDIEKIEWDPKYSVDIEEIDAYQQKMFELFNQLIDMKQSQIDAREYVNMITVINDYSKEYFSTEERYLKRKGYPDFNIHAKDHLQFTKSSISLRRELSEDSAQLTSEMIKELRDWMINHILTIDSLYVPFLRINKHIEDSKQKS